MNTNKNKIGLAHGVFDILHIGHIKYFRKAKSICDKLIVSVTIDKFVNKGKNRPVFSISDRVKVLKSIEFIDEVVVSHYPTAVNIIKKIKPDFYIKGKDYKNLKKYPSKNLELEIKATKKVGGKFIVLDTDLKSSTKILNENFNYLDQDVNKFLKTIDKNKLAIKLKKIFFKTCNEKVLIIGEPIVDIHSNVKVLGKSQKSNIVSTTFVNDTKYGGGIILASNFMKEFFNDVGIIAFSNNHNNKIFKKYLNRKINIKKVPSKIEKILEKKRFVDAYSSNKLFQVNENEKYTLSKNSENLYFKKLKKICKNYDQLVVFDYGYGCLFKKNIDFLKKFSKKLSINCQANSSNFGYNLMSKYQSGNIAAVDEVEFRLIVQNKTDKISFLIDHNKKLINRFKIFIITMGTKGCYVCSKNKVYYVPTVFKNTFDTTGCGDIFFSAFIFFNTLKIFTFSEIALFSHVAAGMHANSIGNKNLINKNNFFQTIQTIIK